MSHGSRSLQCHCQLPSPSHFLTDTLLMLQARTVIKDLCTLKRCRVSMTTCSSLPHIHHQPYQQTQKPSWMRLLVCISLALSLLMLWRVQRFTNRTDTPQSLCCTNVCRWSGVKVWQEWWGRGVDVKHQTTRERGRWLAFGNKTEHDVKSRVWEQDNRRWESAQVVINRAQSIEMQLEVLATPSSPPEGLAGLLPSSVEQM